MTMETMTFDYDKEADVLYISFGEPREAVTEEIGNIGVRLDSKTKGIVGVTIIGFLKSFGKGGGPINISVPGTLSLGTKQE